MTKKENNHTPPIGLELTQLSKMYYGVLSKKLSELAIDRYYYLLLLIKESTSNITQKELSAKLCLDKVFMVKIVDYLAEKEMVFREVNPKDRRAHFILLTPKGENAVPIIKNAYNETNDFCLNGLSKPEQDCYFKVLATMKSNLQSIPKNEIDINYITKKRKNKS